MADYTVREATADEMPFVRDSWARSWLDVSTRSQPLQRPPRGLARWLWIRAYREGVIGQILETDGARVVVAQIPDVEGEVLGWICYTEPGEHPLQVHYIYVKPYARRRRIGTGLLRVVLSKAGARRGVVTHHTKSGDKLLWSARESVGEDTVPIEVGEQAS